MNKYVRMFWNLKEGLIIGAIAGIGVAYVMKSQFDFSFALTSTGLLDSVLDKTQPIQDFAFQKSTIAFALVGAAIGAVVDSIWGKN